jgi:hypothetical protein
MASRARRSGDRRLILGTCWTQDGIYAGLETEIKVGDALEIAGDLEAALEQFASIAADLSAGSAGEKD